MKGRIIIKSLFVSLFLTTQYNHVMGQVTISGTRCAVSFITYDYLINNTNDTSKINICIIGGIFSDYNSTCIQTKPNTPLKVIWTDTTDGKLKISNQINNTEVDVSITSALKGGTIDALSVSQIVDVDSIPINLYCTKAKGGNCSPNYKYQWQESKNNIRFKDIKGEETENLVFSKKMNGATYYRRMVIDTTSNTVAYSNVSTVIVPVKRKKN